MDVGITDHRDHGNFPPLERGKRKDRSQTAPIHQGSTFVLGLVSFHPIRLG